MAVDSDSESGNEDSQSKHLTRRHCKSAALHVPIGGYDVWCMNTRRQFLIKADPAPAVFIFEFVAHLLYYL